MKHVSIEQYNNAKYAIIFHFAWILNIALTKWKEWIICSFLP
jgi:hypothetical protein